MFVQSVKQFDSLLINMLCCVSYQTPGGGTAADIIPVFEIVNK